MSYYSLVFYLLLPPVKRWQHVSDNKTSGIKNNSRNRRQVGLTSINDKRILQISHFVCTNKKKVEYSSGSSRMWNFGVTTSEKVMEKNRTWSSRRKNCPRSLVGLFPLMRRWGIVSSIDLLKPSAKGVRPGQVSPGPIQTSHIRLAVVRWCHYSILNNQPRWYHRWLCKYLRYLQRVGCTWVDLLASLSKNKRPRPPPTARQRLVTWPTPAGSA